jgi:hypothetical protein
MRQLITILIILFIANICKSQNDTLYIEDNYIILNGKKRNQIENNVKNGMWVEYELGDIPVSFILGSGDDIHFYDLVEPEYRALKENEYSGIEYVLSSKCDTIDNVIYCDETSVKIENRIPPDVYIISGKGKYDHDRKENLWTYFHTNGEIRKEIFYVKGLPYSSFNIYRSDKSILLKVNKINKTDWEICKYSESGEQIDCETKSIDNFKELY